VIKRIEGRAVRSSGGIVVVSENMRTLVSEAWDVDPESIEVISNGYFLDQVEPYRTNETVPGRVTFLGTLHPKLDEEAVFDIARLPEVDELVVIGDGAKRDALEAGKVEHGLDSLRVTGRLPDEEAFNLVATAAVAINPQLPSDLQRASSPVKIYYYAALGTPMVLSEGPSVADDLHREGGAVVVPFGESFVDAVQGVLRDEAGRQEMSATAKQAAERMTWERRVETLSELY
jgi:glycosyltransferase involved in cell wall biosynthesis